MKKILVAFFVLGLLLYSRPVLSQELDDALYTYAMVVRVSSSEIVVTEYDIDKDESVDVTYLVDKNTLLENISSLAELKEYDEVEIAYKENSTGRIILMLTKVSTFEEEDQEGEWIMDEEQQQEDNI